MKKCIVIAIISIISIHFSSFAQVSSSKAAKVKAVAKEDKTADKGNKKLQAPAKKKEKTGAIINKGVNKGLKKGTDLYIKNAWDAIY